MTGSPSPEDMAAAREALSLLKALRRNDAKTVDAIFATADLRRLASFAVAMLGTSVALQGADPVKFAEAMIAELVTKEADRQHDDPQDQEE